MIIKAEISVNGGKGGNGVSSFRREKYIPRGGADGGNGGTGGSVFFKVTGETNDLGQLKQEKRFFAGGGGDGGSSSKHGKRGNDLVLQVPPGTMISDMVGPGEEILVADLVAGGDTVLVAKGGRGGLGNARFVSAVNQAPEEATEGRAGEEKRLLLRLKIPTDICIIGMANSGKSTLLAAVTQAKPQAAEYPFTTRQPVLGVIEDMRRSFVVAEIPALVEGACEGRGLGNDFLCHVERTKVIIFLLDATAPSARSDWDKLGKELSLYDPALMRKPRLVAINKVDIPQVQGRLIEIRRSLGSLGLSVFSIAAATGYGVQELFQKAREVVEETGQHEEKEPPLKVAIFRPKPRR